MCWIQTHPICSQITITLNMACLTKKETYPWLPMNTIIVVVTFLIASETSIKWHLTITPLSPTTLPTKYTSLLISWPNVRHLGFHVFYCWCQNLILPYLPLLDLYLWLPPLNRKRYDDLKCSQIPKSLFSTNPGSESSSPPMLPHTEGKTTLSR